MGVTKKGKQSMKNMYSIVVWALSVPFFAGGMKQETSQKSYSGALKSVAVSGLAGGFDVVFGRPCDYAKTMTVQKLSFSSNPKIWYRGSLMNIIGLAPATGTQNLFASLFEPHMSEMSAFSLAGGLSTVVACPADLIVLKMQLVPANEKACMIKVIRDIYKAGGIKAFYRGAPAIGIREWGFTLAYMKLIGDMAHSAKKYLKEPWNEWSALAVGGALCSLITHPMETLRMRQQEGEKKSMVQALHEMRLSELGLRKTLFAGLVWRSLRCTMAIGGLIQAEHIVTRFLN